MEAPAAATPPLRFELTIVDGRARLAGSPGAVAGVGQLDRVELEVPGLRFPFDLSQGARVFRLRRCRLVEFAYSVAPAELEAVLAGGALARFGLSDPMVELGPSGLRLRLRVQVAGHAAELCAKVVLSAAGTGPGAGAAPSWRVALADARVYGFVPVAAPLLLSALPAALGFAAAAGTGAELGAVEHWASSPPALYRARGLTEIDVDAAGLVLTALLPPAGWRLPATDGLVSQPVELAAGRLHLRLGPPANSAELLSEGGQGDAVAERGLGALAEAALYAGELRAATEGFRRALVADPGNAFAKERLFQLLAAAPADFAELEQRADECLIDRGDSEQALLAKAVVAAHASRAAEAAWFFGRAASAAAAAGERLDEVAARMATAEQFGALGDKKAALDELKRVLALRPGHAAALQLQITMGAGAAGGSAA